VLATGLAYTDAGEGRPVLLLHGLTCHLGYWLRVVPLLEGVRVVALDFRGHGLSEPRDSYGYADYEDDVTWLLDRLELDDVTVAGHSLGGYVALLAASRSDRIGRVLAIDVKSDWSDEDAAFAERSRGATQRVEPDRDALPIRLAKSVSPAVLSADELELLAERAIEPANGGWRFRWDRRVLATEPVDPFAFLGRVPCPVHVMAGSESRVMPQDSARRFADAIPEGTAEIVDGASHHVELDAPDLVAERILG
jgi:pimeloyl-ACP methyl ester carboxylesterase